MIRDLFPAPEIIRRNFRDRVFSELRADLEATDFAERQDFLDNRVNLRDTMNDLREVTQMAERMTFLHLGTGSEPAAALALRAIGKLMDFAWWDYFLEAGRIPLGVMRAPIANRAISVVCQYLRERIPDGTRRKWIETMVAKGIEPCFASLQGMCFPDSVKGWSFDPESAYFDLHPYHRFISIANWPRIFATSNIRAVPTNGLLTGAVAFLREFGRNADTERWFAQARNSFSTLGDLFAADGSYHEGVSYSAFASGQMADLIGHFDWLDGGDHFDCVNWRGYARFLLRMAAPTDENPAQTVSIGDSPIAPTPAVPMWLAARLGDPEVQWYALNRTIAADHRALLFYDPSVAPEAPPPGLNLFRTPFDWIVASNGHDPECLVCSMRSGPPSNHEHADRNSITLKCFGELLLPDPCPAPYHNRDESWSMRFTGGHNAVLIDGKGHQYVSGHEGVNASEAIARLSDVTRDSEFVAWTSDASQAYHLVMPDVSSVFRTLIVVPDFPLVVVADKVVKCRHPSVLQARFLGFNRDGRCRLSTGRQGFTITRPGARLEALVYSDSALSIENGRLAIARESSEAYPYVEICTDESLVLNLTTVLMPVRSGQETPFVESETSESGNLRLAVVSGGERFAILVDSTGRTPRIRRI